MGRIPLTQGQVAVVDDKDMAELSRYKWHAYWNIGTRSFYAGRGLPRENGRTRTLPMHRHITGAAPGSVVDHINHDTLDNRRDNLRVVSASENKRNQRLSRRNSSGFKGVTWNKNTKKWRASIRVNRVAIYLGQFDTPSDAARAYDLAAEKHHGQFAYTNKKMGTL